MKKKIKIIFLVILILLSALIVVKIIKGKNHEDDNLSKIVVKNGLSINYLDGDEIVSSSKNEKYQFSITNNTDTERYYKITIDNFKAKPTVIYSLTSEEAKIELNDKVFEEDRLIEYAILNPGETHNYVLDIKPSIKTEIIGNLLVDEYSFEQEYFAQTIIDKSNVSKASKTSVGVEISDGDEGLIPDLDDDGVTYYYRGAVTNNYVRFADKLWRIVRINGNNTVRLVLNQSTDDLKEYYTETNGKYFSYPNTSIKNYLNNWYQENLKQYDKYIATTSLCDDTAYTGTDEFVFTANQRLAVNHNPAFNCAGTKINSKISMLSADEVIYAGGLIGVANYNYYLYNSLITNQVYLLTPAKGNSLEFYPYTLSPVGSIDDNNVGNVPRNIRPVINLVKDLSVTGSGTENDPYEILF